MLLAGISPNPELAGCLPPRISCCSHVARNNDEETSTVDHIQLTALARAPAASEFRRLRNNICEASGRRRQSNSLIRDELTSGKGTCACECRQDAAGTGVRGHCICLPATVSTRKRRRYCRFRCPSLNSGTQVSTLHLAASACAWPV